MERAAREHAERQLHEALQQVREFKERAEEAEERAAHAQADTAARHSTGRRSRGSARRRPRKHHARSSQAGAPYAEGVAHSEGATAAGHHPRDLPSWTTPRNQAGGIAPPSVQQLESVIEAQVCAGGCTGEAAGLLTSIVMATAYGAA